MSNNLTNAYALHAELTEIQKSLADEKAALRANKYAQQFFTVTTWIIYLLFAAAMYAAPLWVLQSFFMENSGNWIAIAVISVFLVGFPTALALGKHAGYKALSKRGVDPRWMGAIIAFFIVSGIYLEITSASSQQQEKAFHAVENSKAGESILNTTVSSSSTGAIAGLIADAEFKLVTCQRLLKEGKVKDCDNSTAKLNSLKAQAQAERDSVATANAEAITAKQSALEKERESHALPIAKSFAELFGSTIATGAIVAALIAALIFEISHSLTIYNEWRIKREIYVLQGQLKQLKINYFHQTGKQFDSTDFREGEIIDLVSMRENGKIEHFNDRLQDGVSPVPAAAKNDGAYSGTKIGFTANRSDDRPFYGFDNPKKQAALDALNLAQGSEDRKSKSYRTANREGYEGFQDTALDAPVNRPAPVDSACTVHANQQQPTTRVVPCTVHGDDRVKEFTDDLYQKLKRMVEAGEVAPTYRPVKKVLKGWGVGTSDRHRQDIAGQALDRMAGDGALKPNPENNGSTIKKAKYILA